MPKGDKRRGVKERLPRPSQARAQGCCGTGPPAPPLPALPHMHSRPLGRTPRSGGRPARCAGQEGRGHAVRQPGGGGQQWRCGRHVHASAATKVRAASSPHPSCHSRIKLRKSPLAAKQTSTTTVEENSEGGSTHVAGAGAELLAVVAQHQAKAHVVKFDALRDVASLLGRGKHLLVQGGQEGGQGGMQGGGSSKQLSTGSLAPPALMCSAKEQATAGTCNVCPTSLTAQHAQRTMSKCVCWPMSVT